MNAVCAQVVQGKKKRQYSYKERERKMIKQMWQYVMLICESGSRDYKSSQYYFGNFSESMKPYQSKKIMKFTTKQIINEHLLNNRLG